MEQLFGIRPGDAWISDALAIGQLRSINNILATFDEIGLDHQPKYITVTPGNLGRYIIDHVDLPSGYLAAIRMACINHDARRQTG
jgi:hypothetical protein